MTNMSGQANYMQFIYGWDGVHVGSRVRVGSPEIKIIVFKTQNNPNAIFLKTRIEILKSVDIGL